MIIGISGKAGSGKDTVYNMMEEMYASKKIMMNVKFAKALKDKAGGLLEVDPEMFESQEFKASKIPTSEEEMTYRDFLLLFGTEVMRRVDPNYWVNIAMKDAELFEQYAYTPVFTDVRFPNELQAIKDVGGIILRVDMVGNEGVDHISDSALDDAQFDYRITAKKGDLEHLEESVKAFMNLHGLR